MKIIQKRLTNSYFFLFLQFLFFFARRMFYFLYFFPAILFKTNSNFLLVCFQLFLYIFFFEFIENVTCQFIYLFIYWIIVKSHTCLIVIIVAVLKSCQLWLSKPWIKSIPTMAINDYPIVFHLHWYCIKGTHWVGRTKRLTEFGYYFFYIK